MVLVDNKFDKEPLFEIEYLFLYFNIIDEKYQKNVLTKYKINYKIKASEEIYKAISGEIPTRVYSNKHGVTIHLWIVISCAFYYIKCKINNLKYYVEV